MGGYREPVGLEEGLARTIAWERANPPEQFDAAQFDYAAEDTALTSREGQDGRGIARSRRRVTAPRRGRTE